MDATEGSVGTKGLRLPEIKTTEGAEIEMATKVFRHHYRSEFII